MNINKIANAARKANNLESRRLMKEIIAVTMVLKNDYPTIYATLDETPMDTHYFNKKPSCSHLKSYLSTLKQHLTQSAV